MPGPYASRYHIKKAAVFLQLSTGLSINGVLDVMRLFPN